MPQGIDTVLRKLRESKLADSHPAHSKRTAEAWDRLTNATADWVDAVRLEETGSYDVSLQGLAAIAAVMPTPPQGSGQDQLDLDTLGPRELEAPKEEA